MDFGLAREIYGLNAWCIDSMSLPYFLSVLKNLENGISLEIPSQKYNAVSFYDLKSKETRLISDTWELRNDNDFDGIGVINLNGPITKGGGASSYGTKDISTQMLRMANDNRVKGFILKVDSGGGSSNAVSLLSDTINEVKKTKPVYTLVEKGGTMASAAYGIGSAGNKIFAEDKMSQVGSIGTMISFEGKKSNTTDKNGLKNIVLYASKSTMKNKAFEEALNNDNYKPLINELLDPVNENFINLVQSNRPILKGTNFDDGHTEFAKNTVGKFIDGIASFDEVVEMVLNDSKINSNTNKNSSNLKSKKMTKEELKNSHPELYNEVYKEGITAEQNRVGSWMVHASTDLEAVQAGIASGKEVSSVDTQNFIVKMHNKANLTALKQDSKTDLVTPEAVGSNLDEDMKLLDNSFNFD